MKTLLDRLARGDLPLVVKAGMLTIFPLGSIHLAISFTSAIVTGNYELANIFHILALDVLIPEIAHGPVYFWISQIFWIVFFSWIVYLSRQPKVKQNTR